MLEAKKLESVVYIDIRPSYLEKIARRPYPTNYTPSIFPKYDGMTENAREHIRTYIDKLTTHSHDHDLRLKEFSKSLKGCVLTWNTSHVPGSVLSWNDLATSFMKKYFALREKLTLSNLQHE